LSLIKKDAHAFYQNRALFSLSLIDVNLSLKLLKVREGLTSLQIETSIVLEIAFDFINWKINQQARNLGS